MKIELIDLKRHIKEVSSEFNIGIIEEVYDEKNLSNILGVSSLFNYKEKTITWIRDKKTFEKVKIKEKIDFIIIPPEIEDRNNFINYIVTDKPQNLFSLLLEKIYLSNQIIEEIGLNTIIGKTTKIGKNIKIGNNCTIEDNVTIGDGTIIGNNVIIKENTIIGEECVIQSGSIIGEAGFGFIELDNKIKRRMPHLGGVKIGKGVEIGANTCIVKGTLDDTIIEDYVKIDNLCHIAHNVKIGKNSFIVAHTLIGGSVVIEENCWIATSVIRNLLTIGKNSLVGFGSIVVKDVGDNTIVLGNPAKPKIKY